MLSIQPRRLRLVASLLASANLPLAAPAWAQIELPPVQVQGDETGSYSATAPGLGKLTEPLVNTPASIATVTQQVLEDRGATDFNDALRNVPGITLGSGEFNWQGNNPYIHGFVARTDMFIDGMRDIGNYYRDTFDLEKIEVLEGPDSILFGRGSTGGVINQVAKQPGLTGFTNASVSGGTADTRRATADIDIPIDELGTPSAVRVNLMGDETGVAGLNGANNQTFGFAPSLAMGIGTPTRLSASYFHQSENDVPDYGLPWYFGSPAPVPRQNFYGYKSDYLKNDTDIGTLKGEHDFSDSLTLREQVRYASYVRSERITQPRLPAGATPATPLGSIILTNLSYSGYSHEAEFENQTDLLAKFDTGPVRHDLVTGIEYDDELSDPNFFNASGLTNSLINPNENQLYNPTLTYPRVAARTGTTTQAAYAMDTMKLGEQWQLLLGARYDSFHTRFNAQTYSVPPAVTGVVTAINNQHRTDNVVSWRGALVYKPAENGTVYLSYGTSYDPSSELLTFFTSAETFAVGNENLAPEKNRNFEVGTKWDFLDGKLSLRSSIFRAQKYNARIPDPNNTGFSQLAGDQQVDGVEAEIQGQITDNWNMMAGYDYLDSNTIKSIAGGPPLGFPLPLTPKHNATLWTTYRIFPNLQIGGGGQYISTRYAQTTAPVEKVPGYAEFDAMAKYLLSARFDVQLNVYNITDKYYYDTLHPHFVLPGAGRSAMVTLNFHD